MTRREFAASSLAFAATGCVSSMPLAGRPLPAWRPGELDIHFIHTGVGEQTFFILPDGTTMLLDCGDTHHAKYMKEVPPRPDGTRYGGEWTSRYIQRLIAERTIDYVMVSHWHADDVAPGGHAVVRVAPGGDTFRVLTLSADDEDMTVLSERHFHSKKDFNG